MAPANIDFALQIIMIIGFGLYFAWGLYRSEAKKTGEYLPLGERVRGTTAVFILIMLMFAIMQAIRYQTWQPIWILGAIALILGTIITLFTRR